MMRTENGPRGRKRGTRVGRRGKGSPEGREAIICRKQELHNPSHPSFAKNPQLFEHIDGI
jgi:hypothetical protein